MVGRKEKMQKALDQLDEGIREFFQGDRYKEYLACMGKFHHYSARNCVLIARQMPNAGRVAGYNDWEKNWNRHVRKGEKGIMILAPFKRTVEVPLADKVDSNGKPLKEKKDILAFRPVYVFDESQTEGDPLPELIHRLDFEVDEYERIKDALIKTSDCPIIFEEMNGDGAINGFFNPMKNEIHIREGMSEAQTIKTMLHEISHSILHPAILSDKTRNEKETEAEGSAYVVSSFLGIDTSDYSFGYVASWAEGKELNELTESVENIKHASGILIDRLDRELAIELSPEEAEKERLTVEIERTVEMSGVKPENVVVVAEQSGRMTRYMYVTNTDETYQATFVLHGQTKDIERLLTDPEMIAGNVETYLEEHGVGCKIQRYVKGQVFDYWYNYETMELRKYPIAAKKELTAMVTVRGKEAEKAVMQLNDAMPILFGSRVGFSPVDIGEYEMDENEVTVPLEEYDDSWPMVQIRYTNIDSIGNREMNIFEFQKMIEKLPIEVLDDPGKYFKVCISYTYNDHNYQSVQDIDLGRGQVDYLEYLQLTGSHKAYLHQHVEILRECDRARHFAPSTEFGSEYEDDVLEWAGYCRQMLNHYSDHPLVPRPPEEETVYGGNRKEWGLER